MQAQPFSSNSCLHVECSPRQLHGASPANGAILCGSGLREHSELPVPLTRRMVALQLLHNHMLKRTRAAMRSLLAKMTADTDSMTWRRLNNPTAEQSNLRISSEDQREADAQAQQGC